MIINEFLQYIQYEKNYSPHTVLSYHNDILQFCEFLSVSPEKFSPKDIANTQIQQWVLSLMSKNISARTLSRKISSLKSFWRFMLQHGHTHNNPTSKIILPKAKKDLPSFFKEREMEAVLDDTFLPDDFEHIRNQLIIEMFYMTGIRLSELINIKNKDIYLHEGRLKVLGKRNKERIIPLSVEFCNKIEQYVQIRDKNVDLTDDNLFIRTNGKKLYPKLIYNIVHESMSNVSSLHKRSPHVLRHTFATAILNNGADINAVKELLGHSSLAATQVYTHTSFDELHKIYKNTHPRAKKGGTYETKNSVY